MESEEPMDMDVDAGAEYDRFDDLLEEGECEDEITNNRVARKIITSKDPPPSEYKNKGGTFITGVDIFSKESKEKMEERARRFNLAKTKESSALQDAENLYESFGMNDDNIRDYRLNVIHMRGTENMSTEDVFDYFKKYAPASLEWINDVSCNVVWLDNPSAARAMLGLSKKITGIRKNSSKKINSDNETEEESDDDLIIVNGKDPKDENSINIKDIRCPLPPGVWRKGNVYGESRNIFLRFATRSDKKGYHAERMSEYYKKHGNPNYGGVKGILTTSRKRAYKQMKESSPGSKGESSLNGIAAKNPWGSLSKNWGRTDFVEREYVPKEQPPQPSSNIKQRLGYRHDDEDYDDDEEDDDDDDVEEVIELSDDSEAGSDDEWSKRSKMPRMRMHADDEEQNIQKRKGKIRKLTEKIVASDLRGRLTARRRLPPVDTEAIQVVVTNPKAIINSDFSNIDVTEDEEEEEEEEEESDDVQIVGSQDEEDEEEGEIQEESESDGKVEYEDEDDEDEDEEDEEKEPERPQIEFEDESSDSSLSEKEVRGPKGSVIKVVQHKPKIASTVTTVWSRLNHSKKEREKSRDRSRERSRNKSRDRSRDKSPKSKYSTRDLRHTLKKTDLRSRIGNHHTRGRSPLRIELRNDKYSAKRDSDSD